MATYKQKKAMDKIVENNGNISKSMREVGYTDATAKNPSNLTNSKGWAELLAEINDEPLLKRLKDIALAKTGGRDSISAIQELFKLKNKYPKDTIEAESGEIKVIIKSG
jgi:hypothetical protein